MRSVLAIRADQPRIPLKSLEMSSQALSTKKVTEVNAYFYGKRFGETICLVSKDIPRLSFVKRRFELASEVLRSLSQEGAQHTSGLVAMRKLPSESRSCIIELIKEQAGLDAEAVQLESESYGFMVGARVSFQSMIGLLRTEFSGNPDTDAQLLHDDRVRSRTGVVIQSPKLSYDRTFLPESRQATYRIALKFYPDQELDANTTRMVGETVDESAALIETECNAKLEALAENLLSKNPRYFADIKSKSPLSERQLQTYTEQVRNQILEQGYSRQRVDDIVQSLRPRNRELNISMSTYLKLKPDSAKADGPFQIRIWP